MTTNTAKQKLDEYGIPSNSVIYAIQEVRKRGEEHGMIGICTDIIYHLSGHEPLFDDERDALHVAQYMVRDAIVLPEFNGVDSLHSAQQRAAALKNKMPWMFAKADTPSSVRSVKVIEGVSVAVKSDGSIKKGGKQIIAAELYKKHVIDAEKPATNREFVDILIKELKMTLAGARTYAHNMKKQFTQG